MTTYASSVPIPNNYIIQSNTLPHLHIFDNEFTYSLSNTWGWWRSDASPSQVMNIWEAQEKDQTMRDKMIKKPVFLTVNPRYDDTTLRGDLGFQIPSTINGTNTY